LQPRTYKKVIKTAGTPGLTARALTIVMAYVRGGMDQAGLGEE